MNSPKILNTLAPNDGLAAQLHRLGLILIAPSLDDGLARTSTQLWSPRQLLEKVGCAEIQDFARGSLERRLAEPRLCHFSPLADIEWNWLKKIARPLI